MKVSRLSYAYISLYNKGKNSLPMRQTFTELFTLE